MKRENTYCVDEIKKELKCMDEIKECGRSLCKDRTKEVIV